jgi:hypothetical protein
MCYKNLKNDKIKDILDTQVSKVIFKEIKNKILGPLYIVCELFDNDGKLYSRGISVRSLLDTFNRKKGKNDAFWRAIRAIINKESSEPIRIDIDMKIINRSFKNKCEEDTQDFMNISKYLIDFIYNNKKFFYKVNSFLPLELVCEFAEYKSEYLPEPVEFMGI